MNYTRIASLLYVYKIVPGVIHNDLNDGNLLVKCLTENKLELVAVIDFTDMLHTAYLFEVAITACYLCLNNPNDPINLTASLIAGYKRRHLTELEYNLLKVGKSRIVMVSVSLTASTQHIHRSK